MSVVWEPLGIVAVDTQSGALKNSWSIPASEIYLAPGGDYLVATGITSRESLQHFDPAVNEGTFLIQLASGELTSHLPGNPESGDLVQFSPAGDLAYLRSDAQLARVIKLETGEIIAESFGSQELILFGEVGLIVTRD